MYRLFREFENAWDNARSANCKKGRRVFLNYRLLWRVMAIELGLTHLSELFPPLRQAKAQKGQLAMIAEINKLR